MDNNSRQLSHWNPMSDGMYNYEVNWPGIVPKADNALVEDM
jgi:hypothetical protein